MNVRNHYVIDETVKLTKKYFNEFDKIVQRLQLVVLQRREKIDRENKIIIAYILNDFKRVYNDELKNFSACNRKKLRKFELMMQEYKLIKKNSQTKTFSDREYVENLLSTKSKTTTIELSTSIFKLKASTFKAMFFSFTFQKSLKFDKDI